MEGERVDRRAQQADVGGFKSQISSCPLTL